MAVIKGPSPPGRPVVFVDKDGTLIDDLPYNVRPDRVRFAPGAREAVRVLAAAGLPIVIATNQSGVARGYFEWRDLEVLGRYLGERIAELGGTMLGFYACPHLPNGSVEAYALECACRKPLPGLIRQAANEVGADPSVSWFVGDTWMDVAAGQAAGCRALLVGPEHRDRSTHPPGIEPDLAVPTLLDAARAIVEEHASRTANRVGVAAR